MKPISALSTAVAAALIASVSGSPYLATNVDCGDSASCPLVCITGRYRVVTDTNTSTSFFGCSIDGTTTYNVGACKYRGSKALTRAQVMEYSAAACQGVGGRSCSFGNCVFLNVPTNDFTTACNNAINATLGSTSGATPVLERTNEAYSAAFDYARCKD